MVNALKQARRLQSCSLDKQADTDTLEHEDAGCMSTVLDLTSSPAPSVP